MEKVSGRLYVGALIIAAGVRSFNYACEVADSAAVAFWCLSILVHAVCFILVLSGGVK